MANYKAYKEGLEDMAHRCWNITCLESDRLSPEKTRGSILFLATKCASHGGTGHQGRVDL